MKIQSPKAILQNSVVYGITDILLKGINFLLLPVYTIYLTTTDYGILAIVTSITALLTIIFRFGLSRSTVRFYFKYKDSRDDVKKLWGTIITFIYISAVIICILIIIFKDTVIIPFVDGIEFYPYIALGILIVFFDQAFSIYQATLPARHHALKYSKNNISRMIIRLSLTITLVVIFKLSVIGVLIANVVTSLLFFIFTVYSFGPEIKLGIDSRKLKETLTYSIPLIPIALASWLYSMIDKIFLNSMISTASVGIYSIGFQFGFIMSLFVDSVHKAFKPWFYDSIENESDQSHEQIIKYSELFVLLYAFLAFSISIFCKEILQVMVTEEFREGWRVIPFVTFSFVFSGIQYFFFYPIEYSLKGSKYMNIPIFTSAALNIGLNYVLIPVYGIIGAAITTLISHVLSASLTYAISKKFVFIKYNLVKMYFFSGLFFCFSMLNFIPYTTSDLNLFVIKLLLFGLITTLLITNYKIELKSFYRLAISKVKKN
tara:strand:+ start:1827 stop:3290 length:1464 start_codon:yes stop_codon:yes gene_type:complete